MKNQTKGNDPIYYQEATKLAEMIRNKEISSVEVVQAHLDRIDAVNPDVNAVVTLMREQALKTAEIADKAVSKGDRLGLLHGVPFSIKDAIDTAGVPTKRGSKIFEDFIPEKDATAVARMKNAGAIPLLKSNIPEFSTHLESDNLVTGRSNNPWNLNYTPGGSSGGEAAVIAAGFTPIGLGSDVAISLRGPAAFTGIAALKATHGRVPYTGHFPQALSRFWHIGAMARTVKDVALGYSIINGADGIDGYSIFAKDTAPATFRIPGQKIRVGWSSHVAYGDVDPEIAAAVADTAKQLEALGCEVEEVSLPFLENEATLDSYFNLIYGELVPYMQQFTKGRESEMHATGKTLMKSQLLTGNDYARALANIEKMKSDFANYFLQYDVLLYLVNPMTATKHGLINETDIATSKVMAATAPFNMTGLPALSVPSRINSKGLPINIQLVSRWFDEATILDLGEKIQTMSEAYGLHPAL